MLEPIIMLAGIIILTQLLTLQHLLTVTVTDLLKLITTEFKVQLSYRIASGSWHLILKISMDVQGFVHLSCFGQILM
jgi:hypothetical protein